MWSLLVFQQFSFFGLLFVCTAIDLILFWCSNGARERSSCPKFKQMFYRTLQNNFLLSVPLGLMAMYWLYDPPAQVTTDWTDSLNATMCLRLIAALVLEDALFYYVHRLLHHSWLYKKCHYFHHQVIEPIAMSALYTHPLEHLLLNVSPALIVPWLVRLTGQWLYLWFFLVNWGSVSSHCGFVQYLPGVQFHDDHHLYRTRNFGVLGLFDWLHGTASKGSGSGFVFLNDDQKLH